jgi:tRNA (guanosine-2'-O-)-methyltransferase
MENDLSRFLTDRRLGRIDAVLARRTRNLVLMVEGIHDPHNIAACMRTSEGLGLQEIHVVGKDKFKPHLKVVQGAGKWLDVHAYESPERCAASLKGRGYKIYAGALVPGAVPLQQLDFSGKVAIAFGNEHAGLSEEMIEVSDQAFHIPMMGFVQSFNISVAAAMCLFHATEARRKLTGRYGDLSETDKLELRKLWIERSVPRGELLKLELAERAAMEETVDISSLSDPIGFNETKDALED